MDNDVVIFFIACQFYLAQNLGEWNNEGELVREGCTTIYSCFLTYYGFDEYYGRNYIRPTLKWCLHTTNSFACDQA